MFKDNQFVDNSTGKGIVIPPKTPLNRNYPHSQPSVQNTIDKIKKEILIIISHYVELKKIGNNYVAKCPFHDENTPSFNVNTEKEIYKCFGCGKTGDSLNFLQEFISVDFKQAVQIGADILELGFNWKSHLSKDNSLYRHTESLQVACKICEQFFIDNMTLSEPQSYLKERSLTPPDMNPFQIGYAPTGNHLLAFAKANSISLDILEEIGLVKQNDNNLFDFFRNRIIFPIKNNKGQTIAFAGRRLIKTQTPKYLNTQESSIYVKRNELYGLNIASTTIKKENRALILEGYTDVLRLHSIGITNSVATCGTALTNQHASLLKRYTNYATLIYDGDEAGKNGMKRSARLLIENQIHVSIITLPNGSDPDSLFASRKIFDQYKEKELDYILFLADKIDNIDSNPALKEERINEIANLISNYSDTLQEIYIGNLTNYLKPKKIWQNALNKATHDFSQDKTSKEPLNDVSLSEFNKWGFYTENNCYIFRNKKGDDFITCSNFIMTPLFHIKDKLNAKRLFELINEEKETEILEISQKDLVSLNGFKVTLESLGNFVWSGGEAELSKLKRWLYKKTYSCKEVTQLGWQKEGFFAWGNGIFDGNNFLKVDRFGIVKFKDKHYYIPAFSQIYKHDETLFLFEKHFIHTPGNISLYDYAIKIEKVFGDNGIVTLSFYFACLFLDIINKRFDKFPLLNMYGIKGSGKNSCAESILYFFGNKISKPNLHNTSKPSIADHVANSANAVCLLDEYRNDLEMEKRELLKGFWDKTGRTRINIDKDKKKEMSRVDQGVIVCGQQIATADIALFNRFVSCGFSKTIFSKEESDAFLELEKINKAGLTHITHNLLAHRNAFINLYERTVNEVSSSFRINLGNKTIETRLFNNWLTIASAYATVNKLISLPFNYQDTINIYTGMMSRQNQETYKSDDIGVFWKTIEYLISSNELKEGSDFKIINSDRFIQTFHENGKWGTREIIQNEPQNFLFLSVSRVFGLYKTQALREGDKPLPEATIQYYLRNNPSFICDSKKVTFKKLHPKTGEQLYKPDGKKKYTSTTALVFNLDSLNLETDLSSDNNKEKT
jgi:DNA primase catalytic core